MCTRTRACATANAAYNAFLERWSNSYLVAADGAEAKLVEVDNKLVPPPPPLPPDPNRPDSVAPTEEGAW